MTTVLSLAAALPGLGVLGRQAEHGDWLRLEQVKRVTALYAGTRFDVKDDVGSVCSGWGVGKV